MCTCALSIQEFPSSQGSLRKSTSLKSDQEHRRRNQFGIEGARIGCVRKFFGHAHFFYHAY